jgi:hypothetical protein
MLLVRNVYWRRSMQVPRLRLQAERHTAQCAIPCEMHYSSMNIEDVEAPLIEARTCGGEDKRAVAYKFMDAFHGLCLDKKDILLAEIEACETLLRCSNEEPDRKAVEKEIAELKMALDLMP